MLEPLPARPPDYPAFPASPEIPPEIRLGTPALPVRQVRLALLVRPVLLVHLEIPEILRRFPALEKIPYLIAPLNE